MASAKIGKGMGKGVPFLAYYGIWGSIVSAPVGSRAEPMLEMHFGVFQRPQNSFFVPIC